MTSMDDIPISPLIAQDEDSVEVDYTERIVEHYISEKYFPSSPNFANSFSPTSTSQTSNGNRLSACFHRPGEECKKCENIVSPRKPKPKGLRNAVQPGVGTGHGRKEEGVCATLVGGDSTDNEVEDMVDDDESEGYKSPRVRNDRKFNDPPPMRITRSMGLRNTNEE